MPVPPTAATVKVRHLRPLYRSDKTTPGRESRGKASAREKADTEALKMNGSMSMGEQGEKVKRAL